ncbi:hypothetical protein OAP15_05050 [Candidatus Pelagibacter sp.]|nr:hypothetical protein [Candidatus Pelagibacter sp.]MDC0642890.1 hypothetical protein [Candidatus Pelagibacter sp.]
MKKILGIIVLSLLLSGNAYSETTEEKRSLYIYNNLSSEYTECQHYYLIASEAVKTNDPDSDVIKNFLQSSKLSSELAFMYGQEAGMTVKAMLARTKILVNEMLKPLNNNYANISILLNKYGEKCKSMIDTPEVRNQYWINKANEKYK